MTIQFISHVRCASSFESARPSEEWLNVEGIVVMASRWRFSGGMATFLVDRGTASPGWRPSRSDVNLLLVKALSKVGLPLAGEADMGENTKGWYFNPGRQA
jgi:hypothetical protein